MAKVVICENYDQLSERATQFIASHIKQKPNLVLGLATGSSPIGVYKKLIEQFKQNSLDFGQICTFNLDEYIGLEPTHSQSYSYFMHQNLFDHVNINTNFIHLPKGIFASEKEIETHCRQYEEEIKKAGGIDLQLLGVGTNGHLAFNEPKSSLDSRTRRIALTQTTRQDNTRFFFKF